MITVLSGGCPFSAVRKLAALRAAGTAPADEHQPRQSFPRTARDSSAKHNSLAGSSLVWMTAEGVIAVVAG